MVTRTGRIDGHIGEAPASSANLGSGFDSVGLALGGGYTIKVRATPARSGQGCSVVGYDETSAGFPKDERNTAAQILIGLTGRTDWNVEIHSNLPAGGGMGSSAALITATVGAAWDLRRDVVPDLLTTVSQFEHLMGNPPPGSVGDRNWLSNSFIQAEGKEAQPDNPAAAYLGGMNVAYTVGGGRVMAQSWLPGPDARLVIINPQMQILTADARAAMPTEVSMYEAVGELRNAALLAYWISDLSRFPGHTGVTPIHENYRRRLFPEAPEIFAAMRRAGALHACMSGSGPTILAICHESDSPSSTCRWNAGHGATRSSYSLL